MVKMRGAVRETNQTDGTVITRAKTALGKRHGTSLAPVAQSAKMFNARGEKS